MSFIAAAVIGGGALLGAAGLQYLGAQEQTEALESAAQSTENWQKYLVAFEEKKYEEARRFRDLAYEEASLKVGALRETLPLLQEDILREPGTSELFKVGMRRGTESIMANLAPFGLSPESSTAGKAVGLLGEGLTAQEIENVRNARFRLAGLGTTGVSPQTGYPNFGPASQAQGNIANLMVGQGAVTGGLYGSYGQTLSQLPLLYGMMGTGGGGGGGTAGSTTPITNPAWQGGSLLPR